MCAHVHREDGRPSRSIAPEQIAAYSVNGNIEIGTGVVTGAILMRLIPVEFFPFVGYDSPTECIEASLRHRLQARARTDTAKLAGASVADAYWTDTDHVIRFSNGLMLHVFLTDKEIAFSSSLFRTPFCATSWAPVSSTKEPKAPGQRHLLVPMGPDRCHPATASAHRA